MAGEATRAVELALDAIAAGDGTINAMMTVMADGAREDARAADQTAAEGGWLGLLHGMPIAIKDNIQTAGVRTTSGSLLYADSVPNQDAFVVERLRQAGAALIGKANLQELAFGVRSDNPLSGQCRNPWGSTASRHSRLRPLSMSMCWASFFPRAIRRRAACSLYATTTNSGSPCVTT